MNRKIEIVRNLLAEILNYLLLFMVAHVLMTDFVMQRMHPGLWILLAAVPLYYYMLREICGKLMFFLALHFLPPTAIFFLPGIEVAEKVMLLAVTLIFLLLSVHKRVSSDIWGIGAALPVPAVGLTLGLYILDGIQAQGRDGMFLLQLLIVFLAGYFAYYFLSQFLHYVDVNNRTTDSIPVGNVFFSSSALASGFIAAAFAVTTLCSNRELASRIGALLRQGVVTFLTFLFSLIPKGEMQEELQLLSGGQNASVDALVEEIEPSLLMKIMDVILSLGAMVILALLLGAVVTGMIRFIREGFRTGRRMRREAEEKQADLVERIKIREEGKEEERKSFWKRLEHTLSPQERIRRLYRKTLLKSAPTWEGEEKARLLKCGTARECCRYLFPGAEKEALELAGLYEKARYSSGSCKGEDVKRVRELAAILAQENAKRI